MATAIPWISACSANVRERLRHYFATYKLIPGSSSQVSIESVYGADHAHEVVRAAIADYEEVFGG